jgi:ribosomal protein L29
MSNDEQNKRIMDLQTELVRLRTMTKAGGSIENTARIRELRKAIARILTTQHEKLNKATGVKKR